MLRRDTRESIQCLNRNSTVHALHILALTLMPIPAVTVEEVFHLVCDFICTLITAFTPHNSKLVEHLHRTAALHLPKPAEPTKLLSDT